MWKENKVELGRRAATLSPLSFLPFRRVSLLVASVNFLILLLLLFFSHHISVGKRHGFLQDIISGHHLCDRPHPPLPCASPPQAPPKALPPTVSFCPQPRSSATIRRWWAISRRRRSQASKYWRSGRARWSGAINASTCPGRARWWTRNRICPRIHDAHLTAM